jgi:ERF superfamily
MSEQSVQTGGHVAKKIAKIIGAIGGIAKEGKNSQQGYAYMTDESIKSRLRPLLAEQGLAIFPSMLKIEERALQTKSGGNNYRVTCNFRFTIVDGDTGDTMVCDWSSDADDTSDKAVNKAATAGMKYFLKSLFLIGEKDDDDPDSVTVETSGAPVKSSKPAPQTAPVSDANEGNVQVSSITMKKNVKGKPYLVAGGVTFNSRKPFSDIGIDITDWENEGKHELPYPVWVSWELKDGFKTGVSVFADLG